MEELDKYSYMYRQLIREFPHSDTFYVEEDSGDYYNRARTYYYDIHKTQIKEIIHDYYG